MILEVGIRIEPQSGIRFFGVEEVNQRLKAGARVLEVRPGGAVFAETGRDQENVTMTLAGCQIQIVLEDA